MRFLCSKHERVYAQQPDEHLIEQWVTWMHSAGICYDCEDWVKAVSFVGSAYDLACIRLEKNVEGRADALAQITLSSIYLANIFQQMGQLCESRRTLLTAIECLRCFRDSDEGACAIELLACLQDADMRDQLIGRFLNLPYRACQLAVARTIH
jgi:hypothetical protein